ncbi:unnamed protein product [Prorocentrum cordatum]|uniref:Uncharacterized protein n=1 Tax=Prorocentrum cordatum TaxID=2364126 RepID=A0ABN9VUC1_9DINO|nr:unnamed protein product [Polarella glacialis]
MDACKESGNWRLAMFLWNCLRQAEVKPNRACFNACIGSCTQSGEWQQALTVLGELLDLARLNARWRDSLAVNYRAILDACRSEGLWQQALELMTGMQQLRLDVDVDKVLKALPTL